MSRWRQAAARRFAPGRSPGDDAPSETLRWMKAGLVLLAVAALAGVSIPLIMKQLKIDPALAGGVVLTTITDVVGYLAFLGLGATFLV